MKFKITIGLGLLCFHLAQLQAQPYQLTTRWGEEIKANRRTTLNDIIGSDETGFYAYSHAGFSFS